MAGPNSTPTPADGLEQALLAEAKRQGVRVYFSTAARRAGRPHIELHAGPQLLETFASLNAALRWLRPGQGPSHG